MNVISDVRNEAKLKKLFVWHCLPRVSLGWSVGRHFFFFFEIYLKWLKRQNFPDDEMIQMDRNEKKTNVSDLGKIFFLSSIKSCESVGNAKQTIFYF